MNLFILNSRKNRGKKNRKEQMPWRRVGLLLLLPLLLLELWLRCWHSLPAGYSLFDHVSYTNSRNMDPQIAYFEARQDWDYLILGSSEIKWGIAPDVMDAALARHGVDSDGFNLGLDGFELGYYLVVLPFLQLPRTTAGSTSCPDWR